MTTLLLGIITGTVIALLLSTLLANKLKNKYKKSNIRIFVYGLFGIIFLCLIVITIRRHNNSQFIQEHEILAYLKDGDVICRMGEKIWSPIIRDLSPYDRRFSHLGIVRIRDNIISVIHVEGLSRSRRHYVRKELLNEFLRSARSVGIYRLIDVDGSKISDMALNFIGIPFDWQFDMNDYTTLYCTQLLYAILKEVAPEIRLNIVWLDIINRYVIPLDIVAQTDYFLEIGYWQR